MRLRDITNKLPSWVFIPIFTFLFYLSVLLYLLIWPLVLFYGYVFLCPMVWFKWGRDGKDALLVILGNTEESRERSALLTSLLSTRAVVLDYSQFDHWERWSLASQLFGVFGPRGVPETFTKYSLPAVIVVKRNRKPKKFTFGIRVKDRDAAMNNLRSELSAQ